VKRRITLVVDDDKRKSEGAGPFLPPHHAQQFGSGYGWTGVTVESNEVIPEPDRVQRFSVRITTKATDPGISRWEICELIQILDSRIENATVAEVQS
jgi:hypothetical protein